MHAHRIVVAFALLLALTTGAGPVEAARARKCLAIVNGSYRAGSGQGNIEYALHWDRVNISAAMSACGISVDTSFANLPADSMHLVVQRFFKDTQPGDLAIFYFSGHGAQNMNKPGLYGVDGVKYTPGLLAADSSPYDTLAGDYRALDRIYIVDCCGSGSFLNFLQDTLPTGAPQLGRIMLGSVEETSCSSFYDDAAHDTLSHGSYFTWAMCTGLQGNADGACDMTKNGLVTVGELNCWLSGVAYDRNLKWKPDARMRRHFYYDRGGSVEDTLICVNGAAADVELGPVPGAAHLDGLVPNPARGGVEVSFTLPRDGDVALAIYDLAGRRVRRVNLGRREAGGQRARWDGTDDAGGRTPPGVYTLRIEVGSTALARQVVMLR